MGRKVSDGKSFDATAPAQVIVDYNLYRINGWNGCAIGSKDAVQTDRTLSFECDPAAIYSIQIPAGVNPAKGDFLYWATNDDHTFQDGLVNLTLAAAAANGQEPAFQVLVAKNANGEVQGRVLQSPTNKFGT